MKVSISFATISPLLSVKHLGTSLGSWTRSQGLVVMNKELQAGDPYENIPKQHYKCGSTTGYAVGCALYKCTKDDPCPTDLRVK